MATGFLAAEGDATFFTAAAIGAYFFTAVFFGSIFFVLTIGFYGFGATFFTYAAFLASGFFTSDSC